MKVGDRYGTHTRQLRIAPAKTTGEECGGDLFVEDVLSSGKLVLECRSCHEVVAADEPGARRTDEDDDRQRHGYDF